MSMFSIVSANSRPSMPIECTASASPPGNGPSPTAVTNSSAHTRSGTARVNPISRPRRVIQRPRRRHVGRRQHRQRQRHRDARQRAEDRDIDGLQRRPRHVGQLGEVGRGGAADDVHHAVEAGDQVLRPRLHHDQRLHHHQDRDHDADGAHRDRRRRPAHARGASVGAHAASARYSRCTASRDRSAHLRSNADPAVAHADHPVGVGEGQIDLVQHAQHRQAVVDAPGGAAGA